MLLNLFSLIRFCHARSSVSPNYTTVCMDTRCVGDELIGKDFLRRSIGRDGSYADLEFRQS